MRSTGLGTGATTLVAFGALAGSSVVLEGLTAKQWVADVYLGVGGGALAFIFWVIALQRATPTQVKNTITVNPIAAALLVGEPITLYLVNGLAAAFCEICIAVSAPPRAAAARVVAELTMAKFSAKQWGDSNRRHRPL